MERHSLRNRRSLLSFLGLGIGGLSSAALARVRSSYPQTVTTDLASSPTTTEDVWLRNTPGAAPRDAKEKVGERLSVNDFAGADPTGVADATKALESAINAAAQLGWPLQIDGVFRYTKPLIIPERVLLLGRGATSALEVKLRGRSCLLKDFDGEGCTFAGADSGAERIQFDSVKGREGDNVVLLGERTFLDWCAATNAGRDNIRVGTDRNQGNVNLWRLTSPISLGARRHGVNISHPTDANGGTIYGCDVRNNMGDGIHVDSCRWCTIVTPVSQFNKGVGLRFTANARAASVLGGDLEANTQGQGLIEPGAQGIVVDAPMNDVGPWQDNSLPGTNRIRTFAQGLGRMTDGDVLAILNSREKGVAAIDLFADIGQDNVASIRARLGEGTGGVMEFFTKRDKDEPRRFLYVDELQRPSFDAAIAVAEMNISASGVSAADLARCGKVCVRIDGDILNIAPPTNAKRGQRLTLRIENHGTTRDPIARWPTNFRLAAWQGPLPGYRITIEFDYDGAKWIETGRSGSIPL